MKSLASVTLYREADRAPVIDVTIRRDVRHCFFMALVQFVQFGYFRCRTSGTSCRSSRQSSPSLKGAATEGARDTPGVLILSLKIPQHASILRIAASSGRARIAR